MNVGFKISGFFIPKTYDTNSDKKLSASEINIFCADNSLKYDDKTKKITVAIDDYSQNALKLEPKKYSIENLKQRYPSDKYRINESPGLITVVDKNTNITLLQITKDSHGTYIDMYDEEGRSVYFRNYDKNGTLLFYNDQDNNRFCPIAENIYEAVSAKKAKIIPTTDVNKLILNVKRITSENIVSITDLYEEKYGQNIYEAIKNEWGLEDNIKNKLIEHLNKCAAEVMTNGCHQEPVNCKIDSDFYQGQIGDCGFLASIAAVRRSPKGQAILNNMITDNKDGTYTVKFKGTDKEYTVNAYEVLSKKNFATGDLDVRVLEIAAEKHRIIGIKYGVYPASGLELLLGTGDKWKNLGRNFVSKPTPEKIKKLLENPSVVMLCSTIPDSIRGLIVKDIPDEADYKSEIETSHAYAIVGIDDENIHIQNPWDTSKTVKIPLDVFEEYWRCVEYTEIE